MRRLALAAALLTTACGTTLSSLKRPTQDQTITIEKTFTRSKYYSEGGPRFVDGLQAGTYRLVGEDEGSYYFKGEGDCVIALVGELADRYVATGQLPPWSERQKQVNYSGGVGGIRLPKPGSDAKPAIFFLLGQGAIPEGAGPVVYGMLAMMPSDEVKPVPIDTEKEFLASIRVVSAPETKPASSPPGAKAP